MIKPILFNGQMVRAILEGRKTTTRRIVKTDIELVYGETRDFVNPEEIAFKVMLKGGRDRIMLPGYRPGDILWVRETFNSDWCDHTIYKADGGLAKAAGYSKEPRWHPSLHMPKSAARIFLKVTGVRVERLQGITDEDISKEGIRASTPSVQELLNDHKTAEMRRSAFVELWNSTIKNTDIGKYGWDANPFVWVYEFERCEKPEDF